MFCYCKVLVYIGYCERFDKERVWSDLVIVTIQRVKCSIVVVTKLRQNIMEVLILKIRLAILGYVYIPKDVCVIYLQSPSSCKILCKVYF